MSFTAIVGRPPFIWIHFFAAVVCEEDSKLRTDKEQVRINRVLSKCESRAVLRQAASIEDHVFPASVLFITYGLKSLYL